MNALKSLYLRCGCVEFYTETGQLMVKDRCQAHWLIDEVGHIDDTDLKY